MVVPIYGWVHVRPTAPPCPILSSPANLSTLDSPDSVTLSWGEVEDAEEYQVFLWPSEEEQPEEPTAVVTETEYEATGLDAETSYSWRIISVNIFGEATGCGTRTFNTDVVDSEIEFVAALYGSETLPVLGALRTSREVYDITGWKSGLAYIPRTGLLQMQGNSRGTDAGAIGSVSFSMSADGTIESVGQSAVTHNRAGTEGSANIVHSVNMGSAPLLCTVEGTTSVLSISAGGINGTDECWTAIQLLPEDTRYATIGRSSSTVVAGDGYVAFDQFEAGDSAFNPVADRITVDEAGTYIVRANLSRNADVNEGRLNAIQIHKNDTYSNQYGAFSTTKFTSGHAVSPPMVCAPGDHFRLYHSILTDVDGTFTINAGSNTWLSIEKLPDTYLRTMVSGVGSGAGNPALTLPTTVYDTAGAADGVGITVPSGVTYAKVFFGGSKPVGDHGECFTLIAKMNDTITPGLPSQTTKDSVSVGIVEPVLEWSAEGAWVPVVEGDEFTLSCGDNLGHFNIPVSTTIWMAVLFLTTEL